MLIVLLTVTAISFLSNFLVGRQFEEYVAEQERAKALNIAESLSGQYDASARGWDAEYIHGVGMYALYDGFIIKVYDADGAGVWDAESHDMSLCSQIMSDIAARMDDRRPNVGGEFVSRDYALSSDGQSVGRVTVSYYGPYFLSGRDFRFIDTLNSVFLSVGLSALALALFAGWVLARRIARPITKTAHIAKQISDGKYDIRFEGRPRTKEMEDLSGAVNHLAATLSEQENLRRRLTSDVAHELRTPISAICSHLEAMIEGIWEASPERLKNCHEEACRLGSLVEDLERLARAESDKPCPVKAPADLSEIARAVCGNYEAEAKKKNIVLSFEGEQSVVPADGGRIGQVVANLVSNAIKYTPDSGCVLVSVRDFPENGKITVTDNGAGISEKDIPLIFERFYRADNSRSRDTGGAGIGLAIVKSIVAAHDGRVEVETHPERGSTFTVSLPKKGVRG
jgi:signal transduction histidine kinase